MDAHKFLKASDARTKRGLVTFDIDLTTAIVDRVINSPGTLFYLDKASTGICSVEGSVDQGTSGSPLLASAGFSLFNENGFSGFRISAAAQAGKMLRVVIASGVTIKPGDSVQSGSLGTATVDGGLARTINNQAFLLSLGVAAVAANNNHIQLWNAATNTKSLILESFSMGSSTAQTLAVGQLNSALTTGGAFGSPKNLFSTAGVGQIRNQSNVGILASGILGFQVAANAPFVVNLREPMVIRPGYGVIVVATVVNTDLTANFEWFEQ